MHNASKAVNRITKINCELKLDAQRKMCSEMKDTEMENIAIKTVPDANEKFDESRPSV